MSHHKFGQFLGYVAKSVTLAVLVCMVGSQLQHIEPDAIFNSITPTDRKSRITEQLESLFRTLSNQDNIAAPIMGILLLTDGRDSTGRSMSSLLPLAESLQIPVYAIPTGTTTQKPDAVVYVMSDHTQVMPDQETTLRVEINHVGLHDQHTHCIIKENGKVIVDDIIKLTDSNIRLEYPIFPVPDPELQPPNDQNAPNLQGIAAYEVLVQPLEGEYQTANNTRHTFVQIVDERIRVVLFENEPFWDTRFLIHALRQDARIDLTTVTGFGRIQRAIRYHINNNQISPADAISSTNTGKGWVNSIESDSASIESNEQIIPDPITRQWLNQYDVVILGKGIQRWFSTPDILHDLTTYVRDQGGSVVMARGMPISNTDNKTQSLLDEIEVISPVKWGRAKLDVAGQLQKPDMITGADPVDLSAFGDTNEVLTRLPGMIARTSIKKEKALSTIWLQHEYSDAHIDTPHKRGNTTNDEHAAVVHQKFGNGQVLAILSHGLWKWAFMQPGEADDMRSVFHVFWTKAIRMLAGAGELLPGQSIGLSLDTMSTPIDKNVNILVQTRYIENATFQPQLIVTDPAGNQHEVALYRTSDRSTRYTAAYNASIEGVHSVSLNCPGFQPELITSLFAAYDRNVELLDSSADHISLQRLCDATGGRMIPATDPSELVDHLVQTKIALDSVDTIELKYLFPNIYLWSILVFCLGCEWLLRRRNGLI